MPNKLFSTSGPVFALALGAVLTLPAMAPAAAQTARQQSEARRAARPTQPGKDAAAVQKYPQAKRKDPGIKATEKFAPKLSQLVELYQDNSKTAETRALIDEILANGKANAYERAFAAQVGAQVAYSQQNDLAAAQAYLKQAIAADGLDNNSHFDSMYLLSQLQFQEKKYAEALATVDRFMTDSGGRDPEALALKGNMLYRLERYPEAATVLKQAIAATPQPKAEWLQLLMGTYAEMGQPAEAAKLAEQVGAQAPGDAGAQRNLAAVYLQGGQNDKAIAILEKLRSAGQLTEDQDYRNLYALYFQLPGKEKDAIPVINEGLQKGVLKPDYQAYTALAQAYYFSGQPLPAIAAYQKAAPLAPDGETYLNLAKILSNEGRAAEARRAAQQALDKGLKNPADARKILAAGSK